MRVTTSNKRRRVVRGESNRGASFYVLEIVGDLEPQLHGPYATEEARDQQAVQLRRGDPGKRNGLFRLNVSAKSAPDVGPYSGAELSDPSSG